MRKIYLKGYIKKAEDEGYDFIASTASVDRQGDSVDQDGWELENFLKNPVLLWAHNYSELPIGKIINIEKAEGKLKIKVVFAKHEKAQTIKAMVDDGFLSATSVGFIAKERNGHIITRAELLEVSIVPVPANPEALSLAYKNIDSSIRKDIEDYIEPLEVDLDEEPIVPLVDDSNAVAVDSTPISDTPATVEEKTGRVISQKNKKALEDTMMSLKSAVSEIEKLLAMSEVATTEDDGSESKFVVINRSILEEIKFQLRGDATNKNKLLADLKQL